MSIFEDNNKNIITFIIPTIGRETLNHSINSIINQTNKNWKCIIVFDGVKNNFDIDHENIEIYEIEKTKGIINQASDVRNYGIQKAIEKFILNKKHYDYIINLVENDETKIYIGIAYYIISENFEFMSFAE